MRIRYHVRWSTGNKEISEKYLVFRETSYTVNHIIVERSRNLSLPILIFIFLYIFNEIQNVWQKLFRENKWWRYFAKQTKNRVFFSPNLVVFRCKNIFHKSRVNKIIINVGWSQRLSLAVFYFEFGVIFWRNLICTAENIRPQNNTDEISPKKNAIYVKN